MHGRLSDDRAVLADIAVRCLLLADNSAGILSLFSADQWRRTARVPADRDSCGHGTRSLYAWKMDRKLDQDRSRTPPSAAKTAQGVPCEKKRLRRRKKIVEPIPFWRRLVYNERDEKRCRISLGGLR